MEDFRKLILISEKKMILVQLLLLLSGDVELNPGPPKRGAPRGEPKKEEKKEPEDAGATLVAKVRFSWPLDGLFLVIDA